MTTAAEIMKQIKDNDVKFVDLRFTDPKGKLQHVTMDVSAVDEDMFADGIMFDGSSIAGWKAINESDMVLMPDTETAHMDPFFAQSTMAVFCDILEPLSGEAYNRDPRGTAKKAEAYLKSTGIGDTTFFGPEPEFFVFDDVRFSAEPYNTGFQVDSTELPSNQRSPNMKPAIWVTVRARRAATSRSRRSTAFRTCVRKCSRFWPKWASPLKSITTKWHAAQHELCMVFDTLTRMADKTQIYKYGVHQVANAYGKTATFMPKPVFGDNGSGMHVHQSIWKDGKPTFAGDEYAGLSETCLLLHRRRDQAREGNQRLHKPADQLLQASGPRLRSTGTARLFGAQPFGLVPHSVRLLAEVEARGSSFPRSGCKPLPRLCRADDGRP